MQIHFPPVYIFDDESSNSISVSAKESNRRSVGEDRSDTVAKAEPCPAAVSRFFEGQPICVMYNKSH